MSMILQEVVQKANALLPRSSLIRYTEGLVITDKKKNCSEIAKQSSTSHDTVNRMISGPSLSLDEQISYSFDLLQSTVFNWEKSFLIGDDTTLKHFSKKIEGVNYVYSSLDECIVKGHNVVVLCISDGTITVPLVFDIYEPKKAVPPALFRSKIQIMQNLIELVLKKFSYKRIFLDGLYQSQDMMTFFDNLSIGFIMRFAKNRAIKESPQDKAIQIKNHRLGKLHKNKRIHTSKVLVKGKERFVTAHKRRTSEGEYETMYLISNFEASPKMYTELYSERWSIEQLFRTSKQLLGLGDCQAKSLDKHKLHIFSVFAAFTLGELFKLINKLANTPDGLRLYRTVILEQRQEAKSASSDAVSASA